MVCSGLGELHPREGSLSVSGRETSLDSAVNLKSEVFCFRSMDFEAPGGPVLPAALAVLSRGFAFGLLGRIMVSVAWHTWTEV